MTMQLMPPSVTSGRALGTLCCWAGPRPPTVEAAPWDAELAVGLCVRRVYADRPVTAVDTVDMASSKSGGPWGSSRAAAMAVRFWCTCGMGGVCEAVVWLEAWGYLSRQGLGLAHAAQVSAGCVNQAVEGHVQEVGVLLQCQRMQPCSTQ